MSIAKWRNRNLGIVLAIAVSVISTSSFATLKSSFEIVYFSDASKTTIVGHQNVNCNGSRPLTGVATAYSEERNERMCGSGGGFECPGQGPCFTDQDKGSGKWFWEKK